MALDLAVEVPPRHLWVPEHDSSAGQEAAELAEESGIPLDPEQRLALDVILAERKDGDRWRWAAIEAAIVAPRQNIKTHIFKVVALYHLVVLESKLITWTAHEFPSALEAFREMQELAETQPHLSRRLQKIRTANGDEGLEFRGGQRLRFRARTKTGGRGLTGDVVILDEAWALRPMHMGSLLPTLSAKSFLENPQILYGSSGCQVSSTVLRQLVRRGRAGEARALAYLEWCADEGECARQHCAHLPGTEGCILDDRDRWQQANLALGRRISIEFVEIERGAMTPEEFARERLGFHDEPVGDGEGLPPDKWEACGEPDAELADPVAIVVDAAPNGASASIAACGGPVEVIDHRHGTSWVAGRVAEIVEAQDVSVVGVDPAGPAGALIPDLERPVDEGGAGLTIRSKDKPDGLLVLLGGREAVQACGALWTAVLEEQLIHRDQPILNEAVENAARRQVGDAWKWSRRDSTADISPLVGVTIARYLWSQAKEDSGPPAASSTPDTGGDEGGVFDDGPLDI